MYYHSTSTIISPSPRGRFNFACIRWTGKRREIVRNVETVSFDHADLDHLIATFWFAGEACIRTRWRCSKTFYQLASAIRRPASTIFSAFVFWPGWVFATTLARAIGASRSTGDMTGGIRMGVVYKSLSRA
jgi:hypothetical protein